MVIFKVVVLTLAIFFGQILCASQNILIGSSGPERVQLVELYSSESCSSCPPADNWISELKDEKGLWKDFVPVVFHVDYWNHLGWKDEFSSDLMTQRQIDISKTWPSQSVYTPSFVVDGQEWAEWRTSVRHKLPFKKSGEKISLKLYKDTNGAIIVKVEGQKENKKYRLRAAQLGIDMISNVTSGENSGSRLKHNFVVLDWQSKLISGKIFEAQFTFKKPQTKMTRLAIAVWIENEDKPIPLQAVGGYL